MWLSLAFLILGDFRPLAPAGLGVETPDGCVMWVCHLRGGSFVYPSWKE